MGFERNFAVGFGWRLSLLLAAIGAFALSLWQPGLVAVRIVIAALAVGAIWALWYYIGRTNRELARFVEGLRYGDFNQGFGRTGKGGFDELGQALGDAMRQLRAERAQSSEEARVQAALADEAPSALLLIDDEGRVTLANKAARKLFYRLAGTRIDDFAPYGAEFVALLHQARDGGLRKVTPLRVDGVVQRAVVSRAALNRLGRPLAIVAVQPIQHELSAVELAAQADLVRVLTHEIMNSMTPVVSLAESAARLMADLPAEGNPAIDDARTAIETLARRASGIMHFVETYRAFSRAPVVEQRRFPAAPWAEELKRLFAASDAANGVALDVAVIPPDLIIDADPDLLAQVAINLIKNGPRPRGHASAPRVALSISLLPDARTLITVRDNGPGIPPALAGEIFLPFFTTKAGGTGVGLSLARRIVTAHGGTIALGAGDGGACFEIVV